jgi:hypothetical protein
VLSAISLTKPRFKRRPRRDERRARTKPVRAAAWAFEERVLLAGVDAARAGADAARWPFERLFHRFEDRVLWPLQDAFRDSGRTVRSLALALAVVAAIGAGTAGALLGSPSSPALEQAPEAAPVAAQSAPAAVAPVPAPAEPEAQAPVLQGDVPAFENSKAAAAPATAEASATPAEATRQSAAATEAPLQLPTLTAAERQKPLVVARAFSEAFVAYEIGETTPEVRDLFRVTAVPLLAKALNERPPRQPAGDEVPRARVLNVVAGPGAGDRFAASASLLRLGTTSELRLDLEQAKKTGVWRVIDLRG